MQDGSGGCRTAPVSRGWDCPVRDTNFSRWLQQTYRRPLLSPSAKTLENIFKKGEKMLDRQRREKKRVKQQRENQGRRRSRSRADAAAGLQLLEDPCWIMETKRVKRME